MACAQPLARGLGVLQVLTATLLPGNSYLRAMSSPAQPLVRAAVPPPSEQPLVARSASRRGSGGRQAEH